MELETIGDSGEGLAVADGVGVGVGVFGRRLFAGFGWYCLVIFLTDAFDFFLTGGLTCLPAFPALGAACLLVEMHLFVMFVEKRENSKCEKKGVLIETEV